MRHTITFTADSECEHCQGSGTVPASYFESTVTICRCVETQQIEPKSSEPVIEKGWADAVKATVESTRAVIERPNCLVDSCNQVEHEEGYCAYHSRFYDNRSPVEVPIENSFCASPGCNYSRHDTRSQYCPMHMRGNRPLDHHQV